MYLRPALSLVFFHPVPTFVCSFECFFDFARPIPPGIFPGGEFSQREGFNLRPVRIVYSRRRPLFPPFFYGRGLRLLSIIFSFRVTFLPDLHSKLVAFIGFSHLSCRGKDRSFSCEPFSL